MVPWTARSRRRSPTRPARHCIRPPGFQDMSATGSRAPHAESPSPPRGAHRTAPEPASRARAPPGAHVIRGGRTTRLRRSAQPSASAGAGPDRVGHGSGHTRHPPVFVCTVRSGAWLRCAVGRGEPTGSVHCIGLGGGLPDGYDVADVGFSTWLLIRCLSWSHQTRTGSTSRDSRSPRVRCLISSTATGTRRGVGATNHCMHGNGPAPLWEPGRSDYRNVIVMKPVTLLTNWMSLGSSRW